MSKPNKKQIARWKENRRKWVAALRSGKFKQADGVLHDGEGYCCLGVLACVAGMKPRKRPSGYCFGKMIEVAPQKAMQFVGLDDETGDFWTSRGVRTSLANENDEGRSFKQIAQIIEREPMGLFRESIDE